MKKKYVTHQQSLVLKIKQICVIIIENQYTTWRTLALLIITTFVVCCKERLDPPSSATNLCAFKYKASLIILCAFKSRLYVLFSMVFAWKKDHNWLGTEQLDTQNTIRLESTP